MGARGGEGGEEKVHQEKRKASGHDDGGGGGDNERIPQAVHFVEPIYRRFENASRRSSSYFCSLQIARGKTLWQAFGSQRRAFGQTCDLKDFVLTATQSE